MGNKEILKELSEIHDSGKWKLLWNEGSRLYLYDLPFLREGKEVFRAVEQKTNIIGPYALSPDGKKAAVTVYRDSDIGTTSSHGELYLVDVLNESVMKVLDGPATHVISFVGNTKLLLDGYQANQARYLYILDLETKETDVLDKLGPSVVGMAYATTSYAGDLLAYEDGEGIIVHNIRDHSSRRLVSDGGHPALSPDGRKMLFGRGGMIGSYYLIDTDGANETLVLAEKTIQSLLRGSGSYRDLVFLGWSPDSEYILFCEASDLEKGRCFALKAKTGDIVEIAPRTYQSRDRTSATLRNPASYTLYAVRRIIDGQTLELADGTVVRLLGVDVSWGNSVGLQTESREMLSNLVGNHNAQVVLKYDDATRSTNHRDEQNHVLAFVFNGDVSRARQLLDPPGQQLTGSSLVETRGFLDLNIVHGLWKSKAKMLTVFLNATLVKAGYAQASRAYPHQFLDQFLALETEARTARRGVLGKLLK